MLEKIRDRIRGPIAIAILILIGVPLAITFGTMDLTGGGSQVAVTVNGEDVPRIDFDRLYQNDRFELLQQTAGAELDPAEDEQLKRNALERLVTTRAIRQFVKEAGFRVGDAPLAEYIRSMPVFQVGGQFSRASYDATLTAQGIPPTRFEEDQRTVLSVRQLENGLVQSAFYTPTEYRRFIALEMERRQVSWAILPLESLEREVTVTDAEIGEYHAANADEFRTPEQATIEYVEITMDGLARDYEPSEEELRNAYDSAEPGRFRTEEERRARHILIAVDGKDEAEAASLAASIAGQLAEGASFEALAREHSDDTGSAGQGGDLGWAGRGVYAPEFEEALYRLQPGQVSEPVRTAFGFHLIRLDEIRPGIERSFDEVRDELATELRQRKAQDEFYALAEQLDELALENPASLDPIVEATGLTVKRLEGFTRAGGGPFGENRSLVSAIFSEEVLEGGENTPLVEIDQGRAVVARVVEHQESRPLPVDEVRAQITERLRRTKAATLARERGEALVAQIREGKDFAAVAAAAGLKPAGPTTIGRSASDVPADLRRAIFSAPKPAGETQPVVQGVPIEGGFAVFSLASVVPGQPEFLPRELRDQRKQLLARQTGTIETESLVAAIRSAADVSVARDLFEADDDL